MVPAETQIGVVTGEAGASADDRALAEALASRGCTVETVPWQTADWERFDAATLGSCLAYDASPDRFVNAVRAAESVGVTLHNPAAAVAWNVHRVYLRDVADAGAPVVETAWCERGADRSLADVFAERGWERAVVKPAVGTGGRGVWRVSRSELDAAAERRFQRRTARGDQLVQRYVPGIADGERSLVFLGGQFSHAFRNVPSDGFRTRPDVGGSCTPTEPDRETTRVAEETLAAVCEVTGVDTDRLAYARVDCVRDQEGVRDGADGADDTVRVLDVSVIAPYLGVAWADTADRLAAAVLRGVEERETVEAESVW